MLGNVNNSAQCSGIVIGKISLLMNSQAGNLLLNVQLGLQIVALVSIQPFWSGLQLAYENHALEIHILKHVI